MCHSGYLDLALRQKLVLVYGKHFDADLRKVFPLMYAAKARPDD
jgi:hypothetical protein